MSDRRKTTRIYNVGTNRLVEIRKEYSLKFGQNLWYVVNYPDNGQTLLKVPTFAEAKHFVRNFAGDQ